MLDSGLAHLLFCDPDVPTEETCADNGATPPNDQIRDTATLDAPVGTTGTIMFRLYGPFATVGEITSSSCTTSKLVTTSTNNTTFAVSTSGTLYWKVEYEGDNGHEPVSSCSENTVLTINNGGSTTSQ